MLRKRSKISALVLFAVALCAPPAAASPHFPAVVQATLGMSATPECILCHDSNTGGADTAHKPFAVTLQRFGAVKKNDQSLIDALQQDNAQGTDSDGDCIPDIDELLEKPPGDPNVKDKVDGGHVCAAPDIPPPLRTGCAIALRDVSPGIAAAYAAFLLVLGGRRARRKSHGPGNLGALECECSPYERRPNSQKENVP